MEDNYYDKIIQEIKDMTIEIIRDQKSSQRISLIISFTSVGIICALLIIGLLIKL